MTNIHDILATLGEAKQALDAQPHLEGRIRELENNLSERERHNAELELTIHNLRDELSALNTKLAGVEAARDEAMFRELEAEDKAEKALSVVRKVLGEAQDYVAAVTPQPEPVKEPEPTAAAEYTTKVFSDSEAKPEGSGPAEPKSEPTAPITEPTQPSRPYADTPHWMKPNELSWHDFVEGGGEKAPWMR